MTGKAGRRVRLATGRSGWLLTVIAAMAVLPGLDAFAKSLADELPVLQIAFFRFAFQSLLMTLVAGALPRRPAPRPVRFWLLLMPGVMMGAATTFFFSALAYLPIADALAIFFVEPLLLTLLAALFLRERIGWRRMVGVAVGLGGAMLVIRPNFAAVGWPALLPLGTAVCFATYVVSSRRLVHDLGPVRVMRATGYAGTLVLGLALAAGWSLGLDWGRPTAPTANQWLRLAGLGVVATTGHFLLAAALRHLPASVIAPFQYLEIVSAAVLGLLIFGDFPDALTWLGIGIIVTSGLFVYWRESQVARQRPRRPPRRRRTPPPHPPGSVA